MADITTLELSAQFWDWFDYAGLLLVCVGVVGESIIDFTNLIKSEFWKPKVAKASALLLIAGLALELIASSRLSDINGRIVAVLNKAASDANERAAKAAERASNNEKEAARLGKEAEAERLARLRLEVAIQPRILTVKQQQDMAEACNPFAGHQIAIFSFSGDAEAAGLAVQIAAALAKAKVRVQNRAGAMELVNGAPPAGIYISGIDPGLAKVIKDSLSAAHIGSVINPPKEQEKDMTMTVGSKPFQLLK